MTISRRQFVTGATAAITASPLVNLGRHRLFASSVFEYSDDDIRGVLGDIWVA